MQFISLYKNAASVTGSAVDRRSAVTNYHDFDICRLKFGFLKKLFLSFKASNRKLDVGSTKIKYK